MAIDAEVASSVTCDAILLSRDADFGVDFGADFGAVFGAAFGADFGADFEIGGALPAISAAVSALVGIFGGFDWAAFFSALLATVCWSVRIEGEGG